METFQVQSDCIGRLIRELGAWLEKQLDDQAQAELLNHAKVLHVNDGTPIAASSEGNAGGSGIHYCIVLYGDAVLRGDVAPDVDSDLEEMRGELGSSTALWLCSKLQDLLRCRDRFEKDTPTLVTNKKSAPKGAAAKKDVAGATKDERGDKVGVVCKQGAIFQLGQELDLLAPLAVAQKLRPAATATSKGGCTVLAIDALAFLRGVEATEERMRVAGLHGPLRELFGEYSFFNEMPKAIQARLPCLVRRVHLEAGEAVFREGENPFPFIVLEGSVEARRQMSSPSSVSRRSAAQQAAQVAEPEHPMRARLWAQAVRDDVNGVSLGKLYPSAPTTPAAADEVALAEREAQDLKLEAEFGPCILDKTISAAMMFGDYAFTSEQPRKDISAVCAEPSDILVLDHRAYDQEMRACLCLGRENEAVSQALDDLVHALHNADPVLRVHGFRDHVKQGFAAKARLVRKRQGEVIAWEGDEVDRCYLILSGSVESWSCDQPAPSTPCSSASSRCSPDEVESMKCNPQELVDRCMALAQALHEADVLPALCELKQEPSFTSDVQKSKKSYIGVDEEQQEVAPPVRRHEVGALIGATVLRASLSSRRSTHPSNYIAAEDAIMMVLESEDMVALQKEELLKEKVRKLGPPLSQLLSEFPIFSELDRAVQSELPSIVKYVRHQKGDILFKEGDPPDVCYITLRGTVRLHMAEGNEAIGRTSDGSPMSAARTCTRSAATRDLGEAVKETKPEVLRPSALADRCASVASMLASCIKQRNHNFSSQGRPGSSSQLFSSSFGLNSSRRLSLSRSRLSSLDESDDEPEPSAPSPMAVDEGAVQAVYGRKLVYMPAGYIFGERALVNTFVRLGTAVCDTDCQFLVIEKDDFDTTLKQSMKRSKDERLEFLCDFVPGVRRLSESVQERLVYAFERLSFPRNHVFIEENEPMDSHVDLIWYGSVEIYSRSGTRDGFRRCSNLVRGSSFGTVRPLQCSPVTIVATTSPCEVLRLKADQFKTLPDSVIASLRTLLETAMAHRLQHVPVSPSCSLFNSSAFPPLGQTSKKSAIPPGLSMKVPRPLSKGIRRCLSSSGNMGLPQVSRTKPLLQTSQSHASFEGLFQKPEMLMDFEEFVLEPGETLALMATKPQKRQLPTLRNWGTSLPSTPKVSTSRSQMR
eukprot:TRINITY_DN22077_c0_g1_i1.p1 TRINITY_DN22077_c0_g1~~TRINITY_DN22077_c0_g1_i1.p1  ORF type:complete len:1157 (+),score=226.46 TRINITY_DN22077_c0_g1_i1:65-3535(+)